MISRSLTATCFLCYKIFEQWSSFRETEAFRMLANDGIPVSNLKRPLVKSFNRDLATIGISLCHLPGWTMSRLEN
jgi:hypothetical protein